MFCNGFVSVLVSPVCLCFVRFSDPFGVSLDIFLPQCLIHFGSGVRFLGVDSFRSEV